MNKKKDTNRLRKKQIHLGQNKLTQRHIAELAC